MTGLHETASINKYTWGVADRGASIRVGRQTALAGKGFYEDRRPAGDIDPYLCTASLFDSALFGGSERFTDM